MRRTIMNAQSATLPSINMNTETPVMLPINAVERETGVSKELLRMWERRYRFPTPLRDAQGDRIYPLDQVNKLRLLRRLIEYGFRPGKIIDLEMAELEGMLRSHGRHHVDFSPDLERELLEVLKSREARRVREYLSHQMVKMGLQAFILDFLQYTNFIVGDCWMRGTLEVYEEHLYTEQAQTLIREAIGNLREASRSPRIMLTSPPDEQHTLGMIMVEALLRLEDVDAISYGGQMPVRDIAQAVIKHRIEVVALSFSASFPTTRAVDFLEELRFRLPPETVVWAGGSSLTTTRRNIEGIDVIVDLPGIQTAVSRWRHRHEKH
jgi:DNA-binding transcriptional MerR regulator